MGIFRFFSSICNIFLSQGKISNGILLFDVSEAVISDELETKFTYSLLIPQLYYFVEALFKLSFSVISLIFFERTTYTSLVTQFVTNISSFGP